MVATPIPSDSPQATAWNRTRVWHVVNLCSLDAVTVGLAWQLVFTLQFCGRFPTLVESAIIGISIWLAYTADRILDSRQLKPDLPHTSRHRFHHQFRRPLSIVWILALAINTILITTFATTNQIRWGVGCLLLVLLYMFGIQNGTWTVRRIPKEIQAGFLFGFGVSLVCWSSAPNQPTFQLLLSTLVAGSLFSINCATVAYWERQLDAAQTFFSWTSLRSATVTPIAVAIFLEVALATILLIFEAIPWFIAGCLMGSTLCLGITVLTNQRHQERHIHYSNGLLTKPPAGRELLADISLIFPPIVLVILSAYNG
ncbi:MAG: hypothetical protein OSA98_09365 [Rubripirellula sp.]|nr:hypothetical protein [Rubripirellula sp.]